MPTRYPKHFSITKQKFSILDPEFSITNSVSQIIRITLFALFPILGTPLLAAEPEPAELIHKFHTGTKWEHLDAGPGLKSGAVVSEVDPELGQAVLKLDRTKERGLWLLANLIIPQKIVSEFKGKALRFECKVKWLEGCGELTMLLRCGGANKAICTSSPAKVSVPKSDWQPFTLPCMIPQREDVTNADIHFSLQNSPQPAIIQITDCVLKLVNETTPPSPSAFIAFEKLRAAGADSLQIVRDGTPIATIITEPEPSATVQYAVRELNEHLLLCTGASLPIKTDCESINGPTVHIGKTKLTRRLGLDPDSLPPDNWVVRRLDQALILSGGDSNKFNLPIGVVSQESDLFAYGTIYAVYEFLERVVGVRWYWPGPLGSVLPKQPTLAVARPQWQGAPSYEVRYAITPIPVDPQISRAETAKWWRRMRWGGRGGPAYGMHSFNQWPKRYGQEHPDWFALQPNGERLNQIAPGEGGGHVCLSNPEVLKQCVMEKLEVFKKSPWLRFSSVMPGDSLAAFVCQCPECKVLSNPAIPNGSHSEMVWGFVNKVAAEVRKTNPDTYITCSAYTSYAKVPENIAFESNVAVTLALSWFPSKMWNPEIKTNYTQMIEAWSQKSKYIFVWDYFDTMRRSRGVQGAPTLFPHAIQEWFLLDRGRIRGRAIQLTELQSDGTKTIGWADWVYDSLNVYVAFRLLWDLDQDVDKLLAEFYETFYGPGGPAVKSFYDKMEAAFLNPATKAGADCAWDWNTCWNETYPPALVNEVMSHLRQAVAVTEGAEPYHARAVKTLEAFLPFEKASREFTASAKSERNLPPLAIPYTATPPTNDGNLASPLWSKAMTAKDFSEYYNARPINAKTEVKLLYDERTLYVGIEASLPSKPKIEVPADSQDLFVWEQDSVELFLVQDKKKYQFILGPDNAYTDGYQPDLNAKISGAGLELLKWNCPGVSHATFRTEQKWTGFLAIPLASLELSKPTQNAPWLVNFCRNFFSLDASGKGWRHEISTWSPTYGSLHNPERFGKLYFEKK